MFISKLIGRRYFSMFLDSTKIQTFLFEPRSAENFRIPTNHCVNVYIIGTFDGNDDDSTSSL